MRITTGSDQPGQVVLAISGDLDLASADELLRHAADALKRTDLQTLVLDLSEVTFIDSTGISALVAIRNNAASQTVTLVLRRPAPRVRRLIEITNLDTVFEISDA